MSYLCPVCGYSQLSSPPRDFMICPSCGTEFGNDDFEQSIDELHLEWIRGGMKWFSTFTSPPIGWNPYMQLKELSDRVTTMSSLKDEVVIFESRVGGTIREAVFTLGASA